MSSLRDESGFSLSELIVVLGLIGFVLAATYSASYAVVKGSEVSEAHSSAAKETGTPLMIVEKYLMQSTLIEEAGPNRVQYLMDRELRDPQGERHVLELSADGRLTLTSWVIDASHTNIGTGRSVLVSEHLANIDKGVPLISYYGQDGTEITDMEAAPSSSRSLRIAFAVERNGISHEDHRFVSLRNKE